MKNKTIITILLLTITITACAGNSDKIKGIKGNQQPTSTTQTASLSTLLEATSSGGNGQGTFGFTLYAMGDQGLGMLGNITGGNCPNNNPCVATFFIDNTYGQNIVLSSAKINANVTNPDGSAAKNPNVAVQINGAGAPYTLLPGNNTVTVSVSSSTATDLYWNTFLTNLKTQSINGTQSLWFYWETEGTTYTIVVV